MHRALARLCGGDECLVDESVAIPVLLVVVRFGQIHRAFDKAGQRPRLRHRLSGELSDPLLGPVGRDDHERQMLIHRLGDSGQRVEQCRAAGDADHHRFLSSLTEAESIERCAALVGDGVALDLRAHVEVVHDRRVARARTDHRMAHAVSYEQCSECVDILFIAIHLSWC